MAEQNALPCTGNEPSAMECLGVRDGFIRAYDGAADGASGMPSVVRASYIDGAISAKRLRLSYPEFAFDRWPGQGIC